MQQTSTVKTQVQSPQRRWPPVIPDKIKDPVEHRRIERLQNIRITNNANRERDHSPDQVEENIDQEVEIQSEIIQKPIYIYFHICTIGNWQEIVSKLFNKVRDTGLLDKIQRIFVTVLGSELNKVREILNHPKIFITFNSTYTHFYERKCLLRLREHAEYEDFYALYIHSKGVTRPQTNEINDWINLLMYFLIDQHIECIKKLANYDTCGVDLNTAGAQFLKASASNTNVNQSVHYSGNFWWANSTYLRRLPIVIGPKYLDPELWIGAIMKKNMVSLWQSHMDHYKSRCLLGDYIGRQQIFVYKTK
jgi:hypothetical protein